MGNLTIELTPDLEHRLREAARRKGLDLGTFVETALEAIAAPAEGMPTSDEATTHRPIWDEIDEISRAVPDEEVARLPEDGSEQHDHYIYRVPKRSR